MSQASKYCTHLRVMLRAVGTLILKSPGCFVMTAIVAKSNLHLLPSQIVIDGVASGPRSTEMGLHHLYLLRIQDQNSNISMASSQYFLLPGNPQPLFLLGNSLQNAPSSCKRSNRVLS